MLSFVEVFYISLSYSYMFEAQNLFIHLEENIMSVLENGEKCKTTKSNPNCHGKCNCGDCSNSNCNCNHSNNSKSEHGCNCKKGCGNTTCKCCDKNSDS